ncbi:MAG TPA: protease pro-enzyme activation domain-containing protein [Fimbriimonas sp.]|nr:protease pro-enzyme activation domain-containing protein [Fimbriimonas sp.]
MTALLGLSAAFSFGQSAPLKVAVPSVIQRSTLVGPLPSSTVLHLAITMPPSDSTAFQNYVNQLSDPTSPNYRKFLTPAQVGSMFGQAVGNVKMLTSYLTSRGFQIRLVADSHLNILADCTAAQAERAFGTTLNKYHANSPTEHGRTDYYSFATPLEVPSALAPIIMDVRGLENFTKPIPLFKRLQSGGQTLTPLQTSVLYDVKPLHDQAFNGDGRNVGVSNFDGFQLSNVPLWYSQYNLPTPVTGVGTNVKVVTIDGGSQNGFADGEGDLDIQMVLGQAPLCNLTVYDGGGDLISVLSQEAQDNTCDIITESYGWAFDSTLAEAAHTVHLQMSAQGITYLKATGDTGTDIAPFTYGDYDPEILLVGGTVATFDDDGNRRTEVGWEGSGGGWIPDAAVPFNTLPSWQVGTGVPTSLNFRLVPDVSMVAAGSNTDFTGAYFFFWDGDLTSGDGTSFSSPVLAGTLAVSEQKIIERGGLPPDDQGHQRYGRINDLIYQQNGRPDVWFDVLTGANGQLPDGTTGTAGAGWDFVTGWGPIDANQFVNSQVGTPPKTIGPATVNIYAAQGKSLSGGVIKLNAADGQYCSVLSVPNSAGAIAAEQVNFKFTVPTSKLALATATVIVQAPKLVSNFLYLYNFKTKTFDLVKTQSMNGTNIKTSFKIDLTKYAGPSNQVSIVSRGVYPQRLGSVPFNLKLDQATITEVFKN